MSIQSYRELTVWQRSLDFVEMVYRLTEKFPKSETYGLSSQMQRAAVSIPANIAEGHDRDSTREYLHHLSYAVGSLAELETLIAISCRLGHIPADEDQALANECQATGRMLRGLQRSLRARLSSDS